MVRTLLSGRIRIALIVNTRLEYIEYMRRYGASHKQKKTWLLQEQRLGNVFARAIAEKVFESSLVVFCCSLLV